MTSPHIASPLVSAVRSLAANSGHALRSLAPGASLADQVRALAAPSGRPAPPAATDPKRAALMARMNATKDGRERYRLAEQINALPVPGEW